MSKVVVKAAGEKKPKRVRTKSLREEMREWKENRNREASIENPALNGPKHLSFGMWPKQAEAWSALRLPQTDQDWLEVARETEPLDVMFGGGKGPGKLQVLTSKVLTPKGWVRMGDLKVGSCVSDPTTGGSCKVIQIFPQGVVPIYRVTFDDGATTEVGLEHLWAYKLPYGIRPNTKEAQQREYAHEVLNGSSPNDRWHTLRVGTTKELLSYLESGVRPRIPLTEPILYTVNGRTGTGPVKPYLLGLLLGDGHCESKTITNVDDEIRDYLVSVGFTPQNGDLHTDGKAKSWRAGGEIRKRLDTWLRFHGLLKCRAWEKFIPEYVHTASLRYRVEFLRGLLDSDGTVDKRGEASFSSTSKALARGVQELVWSLGGKAWWRVKKPHYEYKGVLLEGRDAYDVRIQAPKTSALFNLTRKKARCPDRWNGGYEIMRAVEKIEPSGEQEAQCIMVSSPHGLYITDDFIVTHNSFLGVNWVYRYALEVIRHFGLTPEKEVPHIGWIGRRRATDFVATTLQTWQECIPRSCYVLKPATGKHPQHILIDDRVAIDYGGLDNRADIERFNSAEYGFIWIDQGEETLQDDVAVLLGSRRKKLRNNKTKEMEPLPYRALFTVNPRDCYLKARFVDHPDAHHIFVPATHKDNPSLPLSYVRTLEEAFSHRPDLLKAYRDGDWTALSGTEQIILSEWITAAKHRRAEQPYVKRWVSVDPARFGDDNAVIIGGENTRIVRGKVLPYCSEPELVVAAEEISIAMGKVPIVVEEVGACGVGDYLEKDGFEVIHYCPQGKMTDAGMGDKYANPRARVWDTVAKWMHDGLFDPLSCGVFTFAEPEDSMAKRIWVKVCEQLTWPKYDFRGQKIYVQPKKEIKKEHSGTSPDYAEAYVNGVAHLDLISSTDRVECESDVETHRRLLRKYRRPA